MIDPDQRTRVAANGAILKLDRDAGRRQTAVSNLFSEMTGKDFINTDVIEALGASGSKLAVPVLTKILSTSKDKYDRRVAAEQLGLLGYREALPALRTAAKLQHSPTVKKGASEEEVSEAIKQGVTSIREEAPITKAAVEAIWKIEHEAPAPSKQK